MATTVPPSSAAAGVGAAGVSSFPPPNTTTATASLTANLNSRKSSPPTTVSSANAASAPEGKPAPSRASSPTPRREVDYYLNPTELFRWINYRRWDGAKARVLSHPDECSTWIVSRHSSDGRVLWRHLPLHLVCMQSGVSDATTPGGSGSGGGTPTSAQTSRQIEELIDVLLDAYPDGASSPDDQGMLPLHLCVSNATAAPNDRALGLLLMAYPSGVDVKDKYGRTPLDILQDQTANGSKRDSAMRAMVRAQRMTSRLIAAVRDESRSVVSNVEQSANNERMASQRIIMRLEEELANVRDQMNELESRKLTEENSKVNLNQRLNNMQSQLDVARAESDAFRKERDEFVHQNEVLRSQAAEHDSNVEKIHHDFERERQDQNDSIANLKSEVSTARAMAEAMESQLRSRFTSEEYLTNTVSDLETQLADLRLEYQQETKKLLHERDTYENENTQLKRTVEDITKKNITLQTKLSDLNKQMGNVLSSHGALNAEHDRMMDAAVRQEAELVETIRAERNKVLTTLKEQREMMESAMLEQERFLEEAARKEEELMEVAKEERDRGLELINKMRQDFKEARASAVERDRSVASSAVSNVVSNGGSGAGGRSRGHLQRQASGGSSRSGKVGDRSITRKGGDGGGGDRVSETSSQHSRRTVTARGGGGRASPTMPAMATPPSSNHNHHQQSKASPQPKYSTSESSRLAGNLRSSNNGGHTPPRPSSEERQPPDQHRGPPDQHRGPPDQHRGPPPPKGPPPRQGGPPPPSRGGDGHLLRLLEDRAQHNGGGIHAGGPYHSNSRSESANSSPGSYGRHGVRVEGPREREQSQQMMNVSQDGNRFVSFDTSKSTMSATPDGSPRQSSGNSSRLSTSPGSSARVNGPPPPGAQRRVGHQPHPSMTSSLQVNPSSLRVDHSTSISLDEYSQNSGGSSASSGSSRGEGSDTDYSSRNGSKEDSKRGTNNATGTHNSKRGGVSGVGLGGYSGMSAGLKMGMIRIQDQPPPTTGGGIVGAAGIRGTYTVPEEKSYGTASSGDDF